MTSTHEQGINYPRRALKEREVLRIFPTACNNGIHTHAKQYRRKVDLCVTGRRGARTPMFLIILVDPYIVHDSLSYAVVQKGPVNSASSWFVLTIFRLFDGVFCIGDTA